MGSGERNRVERRLAAILAADIAGYSRLMGADEEGTHARFKAHRRELIDPKIRQHRGRIVKTTGDGMLVEFPSVVAAVRCAVEVQRAMVDRNAAIAEDARITYRVGINLGDIIVDGQDIYGDGVNVAARLEGLAEPGGLCISRTVRDQVRDKLPFEFADLGEHSVKNIARPVHVFALRADALAGLPALSEDPAVMRSPRRRYLWAGAAIALALVAGGAMTAWWPQSTSKAPSQTAASAVDARIATAVSPSQDAESAGATLAVLAPPAPPAPSAPAADAVVWNVIKDGAAPDPFEAFLRIYPDSEYAGAARAKLAALAKPAPPPPAAAVPTPTMEGLIWAMIKDGASAGPFEEYLQTYSNGAHAGAARAKLAALARLAASAKHAPPPPAPGVPTPAMEGIVWAMIKDGASAGPFEEYLQTYPNGDHAGAARAKLSELSRAPPTPPAAPLPATAESADRAPPQTALLTPPAAPSALALDGRWMGDAAAVPGSCGAARMQFEVTGNRISGTTTGSRGANFNFANTATVSGTIDVDGIGTFEWGLNGATGTIKFTGGRFEARVPGAQGCPARIFAGGRTQ